MMKYLQAATFLAASIVISPNLANAIAVTTCDKQTTKEFSPATIAEVKNEAKKCDYNQCRFYHLTVKDCGYEFEFDVTDKMVGMMEIRGMSLTSFKDDIYGQFRLGCQDSADFRKNMKNLISKVVLDFDCSVKSTDAKVPARIDYDKKTKVVRITYGEDWHTIADQWYGWIKAHLL